MSVAKKHIQNRILDRDKVTSACVSNLVEAVIGGLLLWIGPWSQRSHPRLNTRPVRSGLGEGEEKQILQFLCLQEFIYCNYLGLILAPVIFL